MQLFICVNACMKLGETTVKLHDLYKLSCINKANMDMIKSPESLRRLFALDWHLTSSVVH